MPNKSNTEPLIEVFDHRSNTTLLLTPSESKEWRFYSFRLIYILAFAVVLYGLVKIPVTIVLPLALVTYGLLEYLNAKFIRKISAKKTNKVNRSKDQPINRNTVLFRALVYTLLGIGLAVTALIQSNYKLETNTSVIMIIAGIAVYNGFKLGSGLFRDRN